MTNKDNVVLIGMPGSGKSTVGVVLAKKIGFHFMDSDLVIQKYEDKLLHEIISDEGVEGFLEIEDRINSEISVHKTVIATGGSAVYGANAMEHFKQMATVVYLQLPYEEIEERLGDLDERGVVFKEGMSLRELYEERLPLYEKYADMTIECGKKTVRDIVLDIAKRLQN